MSEKEIETYLNEIFCFECKEIKKINIKYERSIKLLNFEFECGHKNEKKIENLTQIFCKNCNKYINCENKEHQKINQINLLFYCKIHYKNYKGYCEICKRNICEECVCEDENYKENNELYFTKLQLEELDYEFNQVQNFFNTIYSLDCTKLLVNKFSNYYNLYEYIIQNDFFNNNIIWNLKLFYYFFIFCNYSKDKMSDKGCFNNFEENNNFLDAQKFWNEEFLANYQQIKELNFDSIYKLFLISKRINKNEIFYQFCNEAKIFFLENLVDAQNSKILSLDDCLLKKKIEEENTKLKFKRYDIKVNLLLLKFTQILIPPNVKRKLINILLRTIVNKYKNYLHKIKPNSIILNSIKRKYQMIKNLKKSIYDSNNVIINIDKKINEINQIKVDDAYNKDNIYFEYNFNEKTLYNTFLFFIQNLYYIKSNETHYSKVFPINEVISKEIYSNFFSGVEDKNNEFLIYDYKEYFNFLDEFKEYFILFNNDVYIKKRINCEALIKALLNNDFKDLIDYSENKDRKELDKLIHNLKREIKNTKIEEIEELRNYYDLMKNNDFLLNMENIIKQIYENKKYHNIINKLEKNLNDKEIMKELKTKFINLGGFPNKISQKFVQLIGIYFQVKKKFENEIKKIEQYSLEFCQIETEKKQLELLIHLIKENTEENNKKNEFNPLEEIKEKCMNKLKKQYNEETDTKYKIILDEINKYLKINLINNIIELIKNDLNGINLNFYIDDSESLLTYCWAIQNNHQEILDFNLE